MKCPKCGYLGFETSDRCRNCGYDFSLAVDVSVGSELPLHTRSGAGEPLADFELARSADASPPASDAKDLDFDRLIGADPPTAGSDAAATDTRRPGARRTPAPNGRGPVGGASGPSTPGALPLFTDGDDDTPLITTPRPPRPPLAVRRTTPEIPRTRARGATPRVEEVELAFPAEATLVEPTSPAAAPRHEPIAGATPPAASGRRILAALIDAAILTAMDAAVIYLTLALAGVGREQFAIVPIVPLLTFLALLNGGYLVIFIAASGQTIGKMATGIQVLTADGRRVDIAAAALRAVGCAASLLTAGLGYLPAFITTDRRALQDRISGTQVVSAR